MYTNSEFNTIYDNGKKNLSLLKGQVLINLLLMLGIPFYVLSFSDLSLYSIFIIGMVIFFISDYFVVRTYNEKDLETSFYLFYKDGYEVYLKNPMTIDEYREYRQSLKNYVINLPLSKLNKLDNLIFFSLFFIASFVYCFILFSFVENLNKFSYEYDIQNYKQSYLTINEANKSGFCPNNQVGILIKTSYEIIIVDKKTIVDSIEKIEFKCLNK